MPDVTTQPNIATPETPAGGMRFGNDLVTQAVAGPNIPNSGYTINSNYFGATPTSPVVTSSAPAATAVGNIGSNITNAQNNPPILPVTSNPTGNPATNNPTPYLQYDGTYGPNADPYGFGTSGYNPGADPRVATEGTAANNAYVTYQTSLEARRAAEIAALTDQENRDETSLGQTQANETGSTNRNLTYLQQGGNSASAQSYLNGLEASHQTEMQNLKAKYTSAVQAANSAYDDKDFALAEKMTQNAQDIKDAAIKRNSDFLDYTLKLRSSNNDDTRLQITKQQADEQQVKDAQTFAKDNNITGAFYQYPGSSQVYDTHTGQPITAAQYQAMGGKGGDYSDIHVLQPVDNTKHSTPYYEWQDYLQSGGKLGFNDYMTMDANRKAAKSTTNIVTYNQAKDEAQTQAAATIGQTLSSLAGPDGYVSPADYKKGLAKWTGAGYSASDYNKQFMNFMNAADVADYGVTKQ